MQASDKTMKYLKHHVHGNRHTSDAEAAELVGSGWVIWPRSKAAKSGVIEAPQPVEVEPVAVVDAPVKRGPGRPKKAGA